MNFRGDSQFSPKNFSRDLNKAYVGFVNTEKKTLATGNWGCGAFGGDLHLKAFQQM
jgi:poly(ADP-ribose) glycohydrolase